jgi:hypothetical protein
MSDTKRLKSPLLWIVLALLLFETLTGFGLFFLRLFIPDTKLIALLHWYFGLLFCAFYIYYQTRHYLLNRHLSQSLLFRLGLALACSVLLTSLSGIGLYFTGISNQFLDFGHVMAGFALLVILAAHLALALRQFILRHR